MVVCIVFEFDETKALGYIEPFHQGPSLGAIVVPARGAAFDAVQRDIAAANVRLPDYARVLQIVVADAPFSLENHALTDNGRLRRDVIAARYSPQIAALQQLTPHALDTGLRHDVL